MSRVLLFLLLLTTPAAAYDATPEVLAAVEAYNHGDITTAFRLLACRRRRATARA
jgi:hypothetical protein